MQSKIFALLFCLSVVLPSFGQNYAVKFIPAELITNSPDAVIRHDEIFFDVQDINSARMTVKRVVTVFTEKGRDLAIEYINYSDLRELGDTKGVLYNELGQTIRRLRSRDESDFADFGQLYTDTRHRILEMASDEYPYTVEYEYEIDYNQGHLFWPAWRPAHRVASIQQSILRLQTPASYPVVYKNINIDTEPTIRNEPGKKIYQWTKNNILRMPDREPYGPSYSELVPTVLIRPDYFQLSGFRGNLTSWEEFGKWYDVLKQGRGELPANIAEEVNSVVQNAETRRDSVQAVYEYLQDKTRYISVQLGIGGFQPFSAKYVAERQYGDCKALSNYLQSLLASVDIESHQVLIRAGIREPEIESDFSTSQFNHAILVVPTENDTIWLDGTSQTLPFGHVSASIHDRYALITKTEGGELVRMPKLGYQENVTTTSADIMVDEYGNAKANIAVVFEGLERDRPGSLADEADQTRERWLHSWINASSFTVDKVDYTSIDNHDRDIELPLSLTLPNYATETGSRVFIKAFPFESGWELPRRISDRRTDIVFSRAFSEMDSSTVHYPANMVLESAPDDMLIETDFARFTFRIVVDQQSQTITSFRSFELFENRMPPEDYKDFRNLIKKIRRADRSKVIFKTNS